MTKPDDLADPRARDDTPPEVHVDRYESNHHDVGHDLGHDDQHDHDAEVPPAAIAAHPAANRSFPTAPLPPVDVAEDAHVEVDPARAANGRTERRAPTTTSPQLLPGVLLEAAELCAMTSITAAELQELRSYGIVTGRESGGTMLYGDDAVEIAKVAAEFLRAGIDARHLRGWRTAAEREASIFEQLITPKLRQRNPESRTEALNQLRKLDALGAKLRTALMRTALRHHFEG
jgi:hypothetical protein